MNIKKKKLFLTRWLNFLVRIKKNVKNIDKKAGLKIFEAAKEVFIHKGFDGARMQEIADKAGISKALLHYYFRSKENLFLQVLSKAVDNFFPQIILIFNSNQTLFEKIELFLKEHISFLEQNNFLPFFLISELTKNNDKVINIFVGKFSQLKDNQLQNFVVQVQEEVQKGNIKVIDPIQLLINILSLSVFPFLISPIIKQIFFNNDEKQLNIYMQERKKNVAEFIINSIKIDK